MAAPRLSRSLANLKNRAKGGPFVAGQREKRRLHLEPLEDRRLMAVGPSLVSVIPNSGVFLKNNDILTTAPRDITFRFAQGNAIDPNSLTTGIRVVRAGVDGVFDATNATTPNDIVVTPGFVGLGDTAREVVMRFASNLPDDLYRITLVGIQPTGSGSLPLRDTSGNPFTVNGVIGNQTIDFNLDLGTKVEAIVPQPITRGATGLTQSGNTIDVYFDSNELNPTDVRKPSFYRLIDASTGTIMLPQSVDAPVVDTATKHSKVTLRFAGNIPVGTYKLEIGATSEPVTSTTPDFKIGQARHVGNSMSSPLQAYIGDSLAPAPFVQVNDVDLYRFELQSAVTDFSVNVVPGATLDAVVRIFDSTGAPIADPSTLTNVNGPGGAEVVTALSLAAGTYYVGISSANNVTYNPMPGAGVATGGSTTGAYSLQVTFADLTGPLDDTATVNNSSYETATSIGTLGTAGRSVTANIGPAQDPLRLYNVQFPGAGDAPGERNIPFQQHILTVPGRLPDPTAGVETITYDFQSVYGFTPQGQQFFNAITEPQKQRAREVLELYGKYLGVQFKEVPDAEVADMTIATGDPRAVAPTISTGTGNTGNGVNGISGFAVVPSNADVTSNPALTQLLTSRTGSIINAVPVATNNNLGVAVAVTSIGHGLRTGDYVQINAVLGTTSINGTWKVTVLDADRFALDDSTSNGGYLSGGTWTQLNISRNVAIQNALVNWGDSEYGGTYFQTAMHQIGHLLGLGDNYEASALTIMGAGETPSQASNAGTAEPVFPGDADVVYGQTVHRPESKDIDLYKFTVTEPGLFRSETVAERLANSSLLNTVLTLYRETTISGVTTRTEVARNDDYYGNDSYLEVKLNPGTYYLVVASTGHAEMNPAVLDSGFGGRTQGEYRVSMTLTPDSATTFLRDALGGTPSIDGDGDGIPGGTYSFYFQANSPANTIFVDKATLANQNPATNPNLGTVGSPYSNLAAALAAADASLTKKIVRIVGNDTDGRDNSTTGAASLTDNKPYLIGFRDPALLQPLADGGTFDVPQNVTVMIDAGAMFKMRRANLDAGTTPQGLVSKSGGAIQVLGTPNLSVRFTSYNDDTMGGDSNGPGAGPLAGDFGGIVYRDDSDHERDFLAGVDPGLNPFSLSIPVFLNYVNHANITYGGGKVTVDSVEETYDPIYVSNARPTISHNTITRSANAAISANPNAFDDDGLFPQIPFDQRRIGLDVNNNVLSVTTVIPPVTTGGASTIVIADNSINGLFIRIRSEAGVPLDFVDLPTRWDATDIVYVVSENLQIAGTPGGSHSPGADRLGTTLTDGRLRIDAGALVKLSAARIETLVSGQFIAEGSAAMPIVFTSLRDDKYGAGGTFDTNKDGTVTAGAPGQWGGLVFGPASIGSVDQVGVFYGGGVSPVSGGFEDFNAIEIHQAEVRIANSLLQFNASGRNDANGSTNRDGLGLNDFATVFVRGAQPAMVNNIVRDNVAAVVSINANSLQATSLSDWGRSTGAINRASQFDGNYGPLVRGNRLSNNGINGMEVRGGVLTTETIWDDTDIVHVLRNEITVLNHQVYSGIRLQSSATQSLIVKLQGANAGFTADGVELDIQNRIGGTIQIVGQPGRPVILTSLADDTASAGLDPNGFPLFDTNNNGAVTSPVPGDWRSVNLEKLSNDTNVAQVIENEPVTVGASGQLDNSRTPQQAQFLGTLAKDLKSGDDTRRLGFQVNGSVAYDYSADVDVYSFNADSGTEVWLDIDRTSYGLDAMVELVNASGNVIARATNTLVDAPLANTTDPGLSGSALTFNKDPFNGRDTYSTNAGTSLTTSTGAITNVTNGYPMIISSADHGLLTGDRVMIEGVDGTTAANGVFTVTRVDSGHFALNEGTPGNGLYQGGGTWTKLQTVTRDPIMRVVLPTGSNGQAVTGPWFIRVRSEPRTLEGLNTGNVLNPGQTSGNYQLQVRLSQKDMKPGSTVRFSDLRYATNAIEVHGLPANSPLSGDTREADNGSNDTFAGAQNLGNLLTTDRGSLAVGGQLSSANDVDWYRFDLNFDLLQFVGNYTDGVKSWSTIFDLDYGDGLSRADATISVFNEQGQLILTGRDSDVEDDQGQTTSSLPSGSFGKHDPYVGPVQLPARVPGQTVTYYVAVTSDRQLPEVLDQTFNVTATVPNVRVEPIEAVARVASDPMEIFYRGTYTGGQTAEFPSNVYVDPQNPFGQPSSTLVDASTVQSLKANVKPFTLADVTMFVSSIDGLYLVDPTLAEARAVAVEDFDTTSPVPASATTDFNSFGAVNAVFTAVQPGVNGNNIQINFAYQNLNDGPPTIVVDTSTGFPIINVTLDQDDPNFARPGTTAGELLAAFQAPGPWTPLVTMTASGNTGFDLAQPFTFLPTLFLSGGGNTGPAPQVVFAARQSGTLGNAIVINFTRQDNFGQGVRVTVAGTTINIILDTNTTQTGVGSRVIDLINAIQANPQANALISVATSPGTLLAEIANPTDTTAPAQFSLFLSGGSLATNSIELDYSPSRLTSAIQNDMADIGFRGDGVLFGYEGVNIPGTTNTAGRLVQINAGNGTSASIGNDQIQDEPAQPVVPPTVASLNQIDSNLTDGFIPKAAMAWGGTPINGIDNTLLYYAIPDDLNNASRLYRANPNDGSAQLAQNQPWGRVGVVGGPNNTGILIGNNGLITSATAATGQTDFQIPGSPVVVSLQTIEVGAAAGGVINFSSSSLGPGTLPQVTINTASPVDMNVLLNSDSRQAEVRSTFSSAQNAVDFTFTAGPNRPGAQGNNLFVTFARVNRNGQGPIVNVIGDQIAVTLDTSMFPGASLPGTTAEQLRQAFDALESSPATQGIITASYTGPADTIVSGTSVTRINLINGADPTTAQQVVNAINAALFQGNPVVQASLSGNPNTVVAESGKVYTPVILTGGSGSVGITTGLAFGANGQLFGVTDSGQFLRNISTGNAVPQQSVAVQIPDPNIPGGTLSGANLRFAALARGPQNVEDGRFANMFFAITEEGILTALDTNGVPQQIFDTDLDGDVDSVAIQTGMAQSVTGLSGVTGLTFTPFDFNLWHPTFRRSADTGHGIDPAPLGTSRDSTLSYPSIGRHQDDNMSFQFGYEQWVNNPGVVSSTYQTYAGASTFAGGTGNVDVPANTGQLGEISATRKRELSTNTTYNNTYDVPAGAYGSLMTDKFSLAGLKATDKPTFYFDYFLDTEDRNAFIQEPQNMRDAARVYIGPFVRFDNSGGPYVSDEVLDLTPTELQFAGRQSLSATDDAYTGKALQFTSGVLAGQTQMITDYIGATRTFIFATGFSLPPTSADTFRIADGYTTWDLLATNNDRPDSPNSGAIDGELPTFQSASASAFPNNPRQQVQLLHDNTNEWRQARVDLSRYAGLKNLQLRFDFTTAGAMPTPKGQLPPLNFAGFPPSFVDAPPGSEYLFENDFGDLTDPERGQNNDHEGFFIDNIIIGAAERGEMVINAPVNTNFFATPTPQNLNGAVPVPTQVLAGAYQLEIRRGTEYAIVDNGPLQGINANNTHSNILLLNTNDRLIPDQRPGTPIPLEDFETGNLNKLGWSTTDDAPWTVSTAQSSSGVYSAASGLITNGQSSGLSIDLITGDGDLTFERSTATQAGDVLRLFIDGRLATYTAIDGVALATPQPAQWSGGLPFQQITVPVSAGHHNFRWTYDKDASGSGGQDRVFLDDIRFPAPQRGVQSIYLDPSLHQSGNPNAVNPPIPPTVPPPTSFAQIHAIDTLFPGFGRVGDENPERPQGHIQLEQNFIDRAAAAGILIDTGLRDPNTNNPYASPRNLPTLNNERLVPGVTVVNNVISNSGQVGISFSGDEAVVVGGQSTINGVLVPTAAVPFGRILNNTIWGGASANGTGILVGPNASPTVLNNIVSNTLTGIVVDPSSPTEISFNLFAGNTANGPTGTNAIVLAAGAPLFKDPANRNFYPVQNSGAVDSSRDSVPDRASIAAVKSAVGIPVSNIVAPTHDVFGQLRLDDGNTTNTGFGQRPFYDRGAVERADFLGPTASVSDPLDNDSQGRDRNPVVDDVAIRNQNLERFAIRLADVGVNIDPATVYSAQFSIFVDGSLTPLVAGTDYSFVYNPGTKEAVFTPTSGIWALDHTYTIKIRNVPAGTLDTLGNPIPSGILDLAGNPIAPNRDNGETAFNIFVGRLYDFGDAPDPTFPTLFNSNGAAHEVLDGFHLGTTISEEKEALPNATATGDLDDGITILNLSPGLTSSIQVRAAIPAGMVGFLDVWIDLNRDGNWTDAQGNDDPGEKVIDHVALVDGLNPLNFTFGNSNTAKGPAMARFRFSSSDLSRRPTGIAPDGEVEDYNVILAGPPFQNPNNRFDVNNSGVVAPSDVLTIINWFNVLSAGSGGAAIPLPPPPPLPQITPQGTGLPGQALYLDVNGDTFLTAADALAVINFINAGQGSSGGGEGEGGAEGEGGNGTVAFTANAARSSDSSLPAVLYASSSVVIEEQTSQSQGTFIDDVASKQRQQSAADLALLELSRPSARKPLSLTESAAVQRPAGPVDEANWETLLESLAADQQNDQ